MKGKVTNDMYVLYQNIFSQIFSDDHQTIKASELLESRLYIDPIKEYCIINKQELHENLIKIINNFLTIINHKKSVIITGPPSHGKSTITKIAAFVKSRVMSLNFLLNYFPIDAFSSEDLLGHYDH